ncbi:hypothetical protein T11_6041 [Trichinella zimbabwensis]|uniref:Uncharacterized protein n=1 Tax=Trichinella zimbabwensis TaxID=268475 RepID=A0A0V1HZA4_9BILA|nr:hypothetical protein T11_6041 [Trichinella zimbabwensis]
MAPRPNIFRQRDRETQDTLRCFDQSVKVGHSRPAGRPAGLLAGWPPHLLNRNFNFHAMLRLKGRGRQYPTTTIIIKKERCIEKYEYENKTPQRSCKRSGRWEMRAPRSIEKLPTTNSDDNTPARLPAYPPACLPACPINSARSKIQADKIVTVRASPPLTGTDTSTASDQTASKQASVAPEPTAATVVFAGGEQLSCLKQRGSDPSQTSFGFGSGRLRPLTWRTLANLRRKDGTERNRHGTITSNSPIHTHTHTQLVRTALKLARGRRSLSVIYNLVNNNNNNSNNLNNNNMSNNDQIVGIVEVSPVDQWTKESA